MGARDQELLAALNLEPLWMPFTANRQFKAAPRLLVAARDMHYTTHDGRRILDGIAGLWAVNAGHCRQPIIEAIHRQAATLDYATGFQMHSPAPFLAAEKLIRIAPPGLDHVFFVNSGSEAVDTALKIALGYHRARGEGSRRVLIGRERGYHGVGFGGISVGGIGPNRKAFNGQLLPAVDHLPHTHDLEKNAHSRGQPEWGAHLADALERLIELHDPSNVAAVIVEPVAGSTGVLVPPKGYLQRLRRICDEHGVLLIFDEVITGFGRTGRPFAAETFAVTPDLITCAKALTNGAVPMGAVIVRKEIYDAFMQGPESSIELYHGHTYSGHPLAAAAAIATLDLYRQEALFERAAALAPHLEQAVHSLEGVAHVVDVRNLGMIAAVELEPIRGRPGARAFEAFLRCYRKGVLVRTTGETIALAPSLIIESGQIDELVDTLREVIATLP
ncbi:MAG: aspartate aminotransferase family protein [Deltaproteobacteria bacterium]|nr:aspartate aminotransferase family protein [Deltaproteobacteria bacterium]